jgi:hypothetical protein
MGIEGVNPLSLTVLPSAAERKAMRNPTLVVMAAGMGSRFGGLKQIEAVDPQGHAIMDFSLYDAHQAGFRRVVFIVTEALQKTFAERIGRRMESYFDVAYVPQRLADLPEGYTVPAGRVKPWGTAHAIYSCRKVLDGPFAVINSDDYYGPSAYQSIFTFLRADRPETCHAMVGYRIQNTVTENGSVARGLCVVQDGKLVRVTEHTQIVPAGEDAAYTEDGGKSWTRVPGDTPVSMNFWGFGAEILPAIESGFPLFLNDALRENPLKAEYFLPSVVSRVLQSGTGSVEVLPCSETWYGVTYKSDLQSVRDAIARMKRQGLYPEGLWDE